MPALHLSHLQLKHAQVPSRDASWSAIEPFALTFNGYERFGDALGELANRHAEARTVPVDLDELRGCLFFEQRRWRHFGEEPDEESMQHIRALVEGIRRSLASLPDEP